MAYTDNVCFRQFVRDNRWVQATTNYRTLVLREMIREYGRERHTFITIKQDDWLEFTELVAEINKQLNINDDD
jgi:hypothetical protein